MVQHVTKVTKCQQHYNFLGIQMSKCEQITEYIFGRPTTDVNHLYETSFNSNNQVCFINLHCVDPSGHFTYSTSCSYFFLRRSRSSSLVPKHGRIWRRLSAWSLIRGAIKKTYFSEIYTSSPSCPLWKCIDFSQKVVRRFCNARKNEIYYCFVIF